MAKLNLVVDVDVKNQDRLRSLGSGILDVAKIGAAAVAGITAVGAFTSDFASDLNESLSKVGVVFGRNAKEIESWSKDAATALGVSQQQALESAGTFGNLFDSMGIGEDASADMSTELVQLASDLASFNNIDPTVALEKLRAGLVGEAEPLRTLGVNISAAATEQKALELGLISAGQEMTAAQKATANYAIIMEQTTNAQGDFARTSDGMANQQRTLAAVFNDTMAAIGQAFIPLIEAFLPQVTAGLRGFGEWVTANMPAIQSTISTVFGVIGNVISFVFTNILPPLVAAFSAVVGWLTQNMPAIQGTVGGVFDTISGVISAFMTNILPGLLRIFQSVVGWVRANLPTIGSVVGQIFGAIANVIKTVGPMILSVAEVLFPAVGAAASVMFSVLDIAFKGIGAAFEVLGNIFETVGGVIEDVFGGVVGFVKGLWNAFVGLWNGIEISVPSIDIPFVGKVGGFALGLPDLPRLAEGGIVNSPTLALIGEKGPEAVVPLNQLPSQPQTIIEVTVLGDLKAEDERSLADAIGRVWWANGFSEEVLTSGG